MKLAHELRARVALGHAFSARKPRNKPRPAQPRRIRYPSGIGLAYLRGITELIDDIWQAIRVEVLPRLPELVAEHAATRSDAADSGGRRIAIVGAPRAGKTTISLQLGARLGLPVRHSDDMIALGWSAASQSIAEQMSAPSWIYEGVAVVRALRRLIASSPDKPVDQVLVLRTPHIKLTDGQARMALACETILREITPALLARGVELVEDAALLQPSAADGTRTDEAPTKVEDAFDNVRDQVAGKITEKRIALLAQDNALRVADHNKAEVNAQIRQVVKIDIFSSDTGVPEQIRAFVAQNVVQIKNLTDQTLAQTHAVVLEGVRSGLRSESIAKALRDKVGLSKTKAAIIANDQVGKLNGELTQLRQTALGLKRYKWATSRDELVRPGHRALDGVVCDWANPPIVNKTGKRAHPGCDTHFFPCRCSAIPMLDDLLKEAGLLPANDVPDPDVIVQQPRKVPPATLPTPPPWRPPPPVPELPIVVPPLPQPLPANVPNVPRVPPVGSRVAAALKEQATRTLPQPVAQAVAGITDAQLDYLRQGMRDMAMHRGAYAGATAAEATAIAAGLSPSKNTGEYFEPIKLSSDVSAPARARGRLYELVDGRHRWLAAWGAGARFILAVVDGLRVIIRLKK